MFAIQRLETILNLLNEKGTVQVNELVQLLGVSDVTIRKDLNKLQNDGLITKTHGGAILNKTTNNGQLASAAQLKSTPEKKDSLAKRVTEFIQDGDTIFLGSGNTCTAFAKHLGNYKDLSIITNNVEAICHLRGKCKTTILIGGEIIFHETHSFTSSTQIDTYLSDYNINKAITSCSGIDNTCGVSVSTEVSKNVITAVLNASNQWYLIADHSKFNVIAPYKIADMTRPEFIFTDETDEPDETYMVHPNVTAFPTK